MIAVAVVAILAAIAYPSYQDYVRRARRSAAENVLVDLVAKEQAYLIDRRQFAGGASALTNLNYAVPADVQAHFSVTVSANNAASPPTFTVTATPTSALMLADTCGISASVPLTIDQAGVKQPTACWQR